MLEARFRPLLKWPEPLHPKTSPFSLKYVKILALLETELRHLRAKNVVVEAGFRAEDIRNDGWPRGGTKPLHGGVVLYFDSAEGAMRMPCATFYLWSDNLYAIALTLEKLRAIDRYGVTMGHEQYVGFKALPPAQPMGTIEDAATFLSVQSGEMFPSEELIQSIPRFEKCYRLAAARLHPDNPATGNEHMWKLLQEAKNLLRAHHARRDNAGPIGMAHQG